MQILVQILILCANVGLGMVLYNDIGEHIDISNNLLTFIVVILIMVINLIVWLPILYYANKQE